MMNRTLTAAVALAVGLGVAGLAYAQGSSNPAYPPSNSGASTSGTQTAPSSPGVTSPNPSPTQTPGATAPTTGGGQMPQASNERPKTGGKQARMANHGRVEQIQEQLKAQHLYNGPIDGIAGRETKTALSRLHHRQGQRSTAMLNQRMSRGGSGAEMQSTPMSMRPPVTQQQQGSTTQQTQ